MDAVQIATVVGGIANTVVAIANILLVLFIYRQVTMQREFFISQSKRDARAKISDSWQKFALEMAKDPIVAERLWSAKRFWPSADTDQVSLITAYGYTLNTLQHEFRFVEEGLHELSNFQGTLDYIIGTTKSQEELSCIELLVKSIGFDKNFLDIVQKAISERRPQI